MKLAEYQFRRRTRDAVMLDVSYGRNEMNPQQSGARGNWK